MMSSHRGNRGQYEPGSELPADCLSTEQAPHSRFHARRSITESRPVLRASSECILAHHGCCRESVGVALWDSLQACIRPGSLDALVKEEVANDFPALFAKYPNITHGFFNGSKAERSFLRHAKPALSAHA